MGIQPRWCTYVNINWKNCCKQNFKSEIRSCLIVAHVELACGRQGQIAMGKFLEKFKAPLPYCRRQAGRRVRNKFVFIIAPTLACLPSAVRQGCLIRFRTSSIAICPLRGRLLISEQILSSFLVSARCVFTFNLLENIP